MVTHVQTSSGHHSNSNPSEFRLSGLIADDDETSVVLLDEDDSGKKKKKKKKTMKVALVQNEVLNFHNVTPSACRWQPWSRI